MFIEVLLYPKTKEQRALIKQFQFYLDQAFYLLLSQFGFFYQAKQKRYFKYIVDITAEQKKKAKDNLKCWDGKLPIPEYQFLRTDSLQKLQPLEGMYVLILGLKFKLSIAFDNRSEAPRMQKLIPMNYCISKSKNMFVLDDVSKAWNNTLSCVTIEYYLPRKYWAYQCFNLLHLLEHCILDGVSTGVSNSNVLSTDGCTWSTIGLMRLNIICKDLKKLNEDFNKFIKSKHFNSSLEFQRLEMEMKQSQNVIEPDYSFLYNSDFKDNKIGSTVLYSLYSLLKYRVVVQNVGNTYVKHQFQLYHPEADEKPIHDYFYQPKFYIRQLQCLVSEKVFVIEKKDPNVLLTLQAYNCDCYEADEGYIVRPNGETFSDDGNRVCIGAIDPYQRFCDFLTFGIPPKLDKQMFIDLCIELTKEEMKKVDSVLSQLRS